MKKLLSLITLSLQVIFTVSAQKNGLINVKVELGAQSQGLKDYYRFEEIDYYNISVEGRKLKNKHYKIVAKEYWDKKLTKTDTLVNTSKMGLKIENNKMGFALMSKKAGNDSVKVQFFFPNFSKIRMFPTTKANTYSLRDPSDGKVVRYNMYNPVTLFAYSLPYEDPKRPGLLLYCEMSKDGIPAEKWGQTFNINHYITFEMILK